MANEEATFWLPGALRERLTLIAETHRVPRSLIVRELLEEYLSAWEDDHYDRVGEPGGSDGLLRGD